MLDLQEAYYWMTLIRSFEYRAKSLYRQGLLQGALHVSVGQEAVPVGVCSVLRDDDCVLSTHRSHGHYLAKTHDVEGAIAEMLGRATGCSRGCGGSMHLFNRAKGFLGSNGIVGGGIPIALGAAFAHFYQGTDGIGCTFFGDGAANQGTLHETLNLASLKKLPFLAVCENNGIAATTPTPVSTSEMERCKLAAAYGIPAEKVDGNRVEEVAAAAERAAAHIRQGKGPYLLDIRTYRVEPHCGIITDNRDPEVARLWTEERDALRGLKERHPDVLTLEVTSKIDEEVAARLDGAFAAAQEAPEPDLNQFRKTFGV